MFVFKQLFKFLKVCCSIQCCQKWVCQTLSLIFVFIKKSFFTKFNIIYTCKCIFGINMQRQVRVHIPHEGGWGIQGNINFHKWWTHCCQKWVCQTLCLIFVFIKKWFRQNLILFKLENVFFGVNMQRRCEGTFPMKEGGEYRQTLNFAFDKLLPKVNLSNSFSNFCSHKKWKSPNFDIIYTCKCIFGISMQRQLRWHIPHEGGWGI